MGGIDELRQKYRDALGQWWADKMSLSLLRQICGNDVLLRYGVKTGSESAEKWRHYERVLVQLHSLNMYGGLSMRAPKIGFTALGRHPSWAA